MVGGSVSGVDKQCYRGEYFAGSHMCIAQGECMKLGKYFRWKVQTLVQYFFHTWALAIMFDGIVRCIRASK